MIRVERYRFLNMENVYARVILDEYPCIVFNAPYYRDSKMRNKIINFEGEYRFQEEARIHLKIRKTELDRLNKEAHAHPDYTHIKLYYLAENENVLFEKYALK